MTQPLASLTNRIIANPDLAQLNLNEREAIYKAAAVIRSTLDYDEVLQEIAKQLCTALDATSAYIFSFDASKATSTVLTEFFSANTCAKERKSDLGKTYTLAEELIGDVHALRSGGPMIHHLNDPDLDPRTRAELEESGVQSALTIPLRINGQTFAFTEIWESRHHRAFTENEIALAVGITQQAPAAIENARIYAETQRNLREQTALRTAISAISSTLDLTTVLSRIAEQMGLAVDSTSVYISDWIADNRSMKVLAEYYSPEASSAELVSDLGVEYSLESEEFVSKMLNGVPDTEHIDSPDILDADRAILEEYDAKSVIYIPLILQGKLTAIAEIWDSRQRRDFTSDEIDLVKRIAQHGAVAIQNARLFAKTQVEIRERKRAEKELQESNRRLDETLAELRETQRIAILQERLAAVGQLAAGIAHDFNNIMAAISLFSDLLLREPNLSTKGRERLSIIIKQTHRAATLIRQILDFSRKTVMDMHPIDLGPFLKEFEKLIERTLPENILLILVCDNKEFIVNADPGRIQQVFMNLVLNARDAMRKGGELRIEIDHYRFRPDQQTPFPGMDRSGWVRIKVADTGTGIPADVLPYIFEPFFTTKGPGQGTGLGLAQVYGIVKQHNGFIDVASQDGEGTIFTIYLPSLEILIPKEPMLERHLIDNGDGETILVVEDDEAARQGICETLEGLNYHVLRASNGREALTFIGAGAESVDLVLSDIVMPEMGGMELYQEVQEIAPELPLVLITGYPLGKGTRELLDENRMVWLQKPLDVEELAREMRKMLRKRRG
jgi:signal transduction histidine kinase/CheY-like chemotaxis protein